MVGNRAGTRVGSKRRGALAALLVVLVAACEVQEVAPVEGLLGVEQSQLRFGPVQVGGVRQQPLVLTSLGRKTLAVALRTQGPFRVESTQLTLQPGERAEVPVTFAPESVGAQEGTLWVLSEEGAHTLPLFGEAAALEVCQTDDPCSLVRRDAQTGACVLVPRDEGAACTTACIAEGQCRQGTCTGVAVQCDDGNACTTDACEPSRGCVHAAAACPAPDDACQVATCDPVLGCRAVDVVDGTPCGEMACGAAHVCLSGQCVVRALPEGTPCAPATLCQEEGRCQQGSCVQPEATPLRPDWTVQLPAGSFIAHFGAADAAGNLYWVEEVRTQGQPSRYALVGADASGKVRFRAHAFDGYASNDRMQVMVAGETVLVVDPTHLAAFDRRDGTALWSGWPGSTVEESFCATHDGADTLLLVLRDESVYAAGSVKGLSLSTGEVRWELPALPRPTDVVGCAADGQGRFYVAHQAWRGGRTWVLVESRAADGTLRWRYEAPSAWAGLSAVAEGRVMLKDGSILRASDGAPLGQVPLAWDALSWTSSPLLSAGEGMLLTWSEAPNSGGGELLRLSPTSGTVQAQVPFRTLGEPDVFTSPVLTARGTVLLTTTHPQMRPVLHEVGADGGLRLACPLEGPAGEVPVPLWRAPFALTEGQWVLPARFAGGRTQVMGYRLPGAREAAGGWTSSVGSMRADRRERPLASVGGLVGRSE